MNINDTVAIYIYILIVAEQDQKNKIIKSGISKHLKLFETPK